MAKDAKIHTSLLKPWHGEKTEDGTLLKPQGKKPRVFIRTKGPLKGWISVGLRDPLHQTAEPPACLVALTPTQLSRRLKQRED